MRFEMKTACPLVLIAVLCLASICWAQSAETLPAQSQSTSESSSASGQGSEVIFRLEWDKGVPWVQYAVTMWGNGKTHFDGMPNPHAGNDTDPYQRDFTMSDANRVKILELAKRLDYFQGNFEAKQKNLAQTGKKTLEYKGQADGRGAPVEHATTYNYSPNPDVQELTRIFQGIASTLDYERKLEFQYRFDKLGMDQRLKELQDLQAHKYVEELQVLEPILTKIANDPSIMHISRQIAQQLLRSLNPSGAAPANTSP